MSQGPDRAPRTDIDVTTEATENAERVKSGVRLVPSVVSVVQYRIQGVRTLASGSRRAGSYSVRWDARDSHGKRVPRGVYFDRLDTPGFRDVKKAVVAR